MARYFNVILVLIFNFTKNDAVELITKKSDCKKLEQTTIVKSPKDIIRARDEKQPGGHTAIIKPFPSFTPIEHVSFWRVGL